MKFWKYSYIFVGAEIYFKLIFQILLMYTLKIIPLKKLKKISVYVCVIYIEI